jgi:DNA-binding NarL/FixJ family response regulator
VSRVTVTIVGRPKIIAGARLALSRDQNIRLIGCGNDVSDIFREPREEPQIVLIDFFVVSEAHYAMLAELRRSRPKCKVIFLCDGADQTKLIDAFRFGAFGYLEAKSSGVFLAKSVHAVSNGEAWVPRHFVSKIVECLRQAPL